MAQQTAIKIRRSSVASKIPLTTDLVLGELALNTYDGVLYFKKSPSGVDSIVAVVTLDGTQTLTNKTLTSPTINSGALSGTFSGNTTLSGVVTLSNTTDATNTTTAGTIVSGGLAVAKTIYADQIRAMNNGAGTNYYVGDDAMIGDVNAANTLSIRGQQDSTQGYIVFGSSNNTTYIGRSGTGAITVTGAFAVTGTFADSTGSVGTNNQILSSTATGTKWITSSSGSSGTVTSVSVVSANGFAGTVANSTTTPAITLTTSITGLLKGNGTAISAASAGTDYIAPYGSTTANYVLASPNGSAGTPTFRALVAADIPALAYAPTAGSSSITTLGTIATGTWNGSVISALYGGTGVSNNPASTLTISGAFGTTLTVSGTTTLTLPTTGTLATTTQSFYIGTTSVAINASSGSITSLAVNISGSAANLSGTQTQNYVYAAPSGSNGTASFRALVASDIPPVTNIAGGTTGAIHYQSGANVTAFLSGNTTTTPQFVTSTGTGSAAQAPTLTSSTGSGNVVLATSPSIATSLTTASTSFDLINTTATTVNFAKVATALSIGAGTGTTTVNNDLTVTGNLDVKGTTTFVESTTVQVTDKNLEIGKVATPTDTTADGGGITLLGATNKTIIWDSANNNWTSSENWNLATGKTFKINNATVLNSTTLGSGVTSSSLTSVGTIATGTWQGTIVSPTYGGTGVNNGSNTITVGGNVTHSGAYTQTFTATDNTSVTLPTTGTLATLAGSESLSNKTLVSVVLTGTVTANGGVGTAGQVLSSTGTGVQWIDAGGAATAVSYDTQTLTTAQQTQARANINAASPDDAYIYSLIF